MSLLNRKIAIRWAKALYNLAEEQNNVEEVYEDLLALKKVIEESKEFAAFLRSPAIFNHRKANIIEKLFSGKLGKMTLLFIVKLADRGRAPVLYDLINEFQEIYFDKNNILPVKLITAVALPEDIKNLFINKLTDFYKKKILLETEVNPNLIGGFQLWIKNKLLDTSVSTELKRLRKLFTQNLFVKEI